MRKGKGQERGEREEVRRKVEEGKGRWKEEGRGGREGGKGEGRVSRRTLRDGREGETRRKVVFLMSRFRSSSDLVLEEAEWEAQDDEFAAMVTAIMMVMIMITMI